MDLRLHGDSGIQVTKAIRAEYPEARVLVISNYDGDEDILVTSDLTRGVLASPNVDLGPPPDGAPPCGEMVLYEDFGSAPFTRNALRWNGSDPLRPANLNGDTCADFVTQIYYKAYDVGSVQSIIGDGVGPGAWRYLEVSGIEESLLTHTATGDFDGDGLDDIYAWNPRSRGPDVRVLLNRTPRPTLRTPTQE